LTFQPVTMALSEEKIIAEIRNVIELIFEDLSSREQLTVRGVRDTVEPKLGLEKGFLTRQEWKEKSKILIKDYAV
jgi:hypothetical protein